MNQLNPRSPSAKNGTMGQGKGRRLLMDARAADGGNDALARRLGWFGLGLGVTQLLFPDAVVRLVGVPVDSGSRWLMRAIGLREIASAMGIFLGKNPSKWVWLRVGGDVMDLTLLGGIIESGTGDLNRAKLAIGAVAGVTLADTHSASRLHDGGILPGIGGNDGTIHVERAITINRPPDEVYAFWRKLEQLPTFMQHLESVEETGDRRSHWIAKGPAGLNIEWDAEIVDDIPGQSIAWKSLPGARVHNAGEVYFSQAPGERGTEVRVYLSYAPPAGAIGEKIAKLFGEEPSLQMREDLHRLKQVMETGEVLRSDATRKHGARLRQQPAQPPEVGIAVV